MKEETLSLLLLLCFIVSATSARQQQQPQHGNDCVCTVRLDKICVSGGGRETWGELQVHATIQGQRFPPKAGFFTLHSGYDCVDIDDDDDDDGAETNSICVKKKGIFISATQLNFGDFSDEVMFKTPLLLSKKNNNDNPCENIPPVKWMNQMSTLEFIFSEVTAATTAIGEDGEAASSQQQHDASSSNTAGDEL